MPEMRIFGVICQECKRFVPLGKIEIEATAPPSKLYDKLREIGRKEDWGVCGNPECETKTFCVRDRTIFQA